jgi:GntR family transcriptional regulator
VKPLMTMLDLASPIPLYHQISRDIYRRIAEGQYVVGGALPTEEELSAEFTVSRATVRQAIGELVEQRLVTRRRGSGTFVQKGADHMLGQRFRGSLLDLMNETRRARVSEVDMETEVPIPKRIAELLQLDQPVGSVVRRTRTMDGEPFSYTINYLPLPVAALLSEADLNAESIMWLLEAKGVRLVGATQSIRAQVADSEVGRRLSQPFGGAVLFVERLVIAERQRAVEVVQSWYRGDRYEYTVTLDLKRRSRDQLHAQLA